MSIDRAAAELEPESAPEWRVGIITRGLGRKRVRSLTVAECDAFLLAAAAGAFSSTGTKGRGQIGTGQLRRVRAMLIRALRNDVRLGTLNRNVAELSNLPNSDTDTRPRRALSADELARLRDHATGAIAVLIEFSARYALWPGEARAVTWSAIDFDDMRLHTGPRLNRNNHPIGPKTKNAARTLRIDGATAELLNEWRAEQNQARRHARQLWSPGDHVATTAAGTPIGHRNVHRSLAALSKTADVTPAASHYELRHTAITFQATGPWSTRQIADWAGTSERMIADVYRHRLTDESDLGPAS